MTISLVTPTITEYQLSELSHALVQREVSSNVSDLIHAICEGWGYVGPAVEGLSDLVSQTFDLRCSCPDWKGAAEAAGWTKREDGLFINPECMLVGDDGTTDFDPRGYHDWEDLCLDQGVDTEGRFTDAHEEQWIVSKSLGEKLAAEDERVDLDFRGLAIWSRVGGGVAPEKDQAIRKIALKLRNATVAA